MILKKLFQNISIQKHEQRRTELYRNLIRREAKIGGQVFGEVPADRRREFFCLDEHTWVWHEEWLDNAGQRLARTTRYDVRPNGILKAQDGQAYQRVSPKEAYRLYQAAQAYSTRINDELYKIA